ncbi:hypothetical protein [Catenulispora rubra]|uniref:hypothetical protein n=1 Tax=Catenulispora rubra TaxID=280293 RepID=UPI0018921EDA|nr:hypothetical protein [Catenulispora rubra]
MLYADGQGCGTLIAEDLAEALAIFIALGFWHEAGHGFPLETTEENLRASEPDIDTIRAGLYAATGIAPLTAEQARDRLLAAAARTAPDNSRWPTSPGPGPTTCCSRRRGGSPVSLVRWGRPGSSFGR